MKEILGVDLSLARVHEYSTKIRERQLDSFGHVNNAQYMILLEEARWEMSASRGYGFSYVHQHQIGSVVLECSLRFKKELKLYDQVVVQTKVDSFLRNLVRLKQKIVKQDGGIAAEAEFLMGCFDLKERKLLHPTEDWLKALIGN